MHRALFRFAALALVCASCADEQPLIDRSQPNGVAKALFQGEWYYQQTVVEIPGTWSFTFVGETNWMGMERIRWDIQENWLYARRSFERIKGAEVDNIPAEPAPGEEYYGAILAAYRIQSHFDLKRSYNPSTGEEYNVLEENTYDNPWYDREYMRVDWSQNAATEFQFLVDDVASDPVAYYIQDPTDPDYPVFDPGSFDADGAMLRAPYIDVTNTVMTQPGMTYFEEIGESYPTCWLFSRATSDCTTEIVKVRSSFLRIDPAHEYVPRPFKGPITDHFGVFTQDRLVFDPDREVTHRATERYAQLQNIWQDWVDDNGNPNDPGDLQVKPMVYYVHNWPESQEAALRATEAEWNAIFQRAAGYARGDNGPVSEQVMIACHWPLRASDDPAKCVPAEYLNEDGTIDPAFNPRLGDVRYSWIAFVDRYYDGFALLGLGPSNSDPLTGEVISSGAYMYIYNDIVTQTTADQVRLLNEDIDPTQYIDGVDLTEWSKAVQAKMHEQRVVPASELTRMAAAQDTGWARGVGVYASPETLANYNGRPMREFLRDAMPAFYDAGGFNGTYDDSEGRLQSLAGTYIEDLLLNPEIKLAAGIMPGSDLGTFTDEMMRTASVARMGPFKVMKAISDRKDFYAKVKNVDLMDTADDGYWGLAQRFKGMPEEDLKAFIGEDVYHAVLAHELGHSFNLHHNFGGTEDVLNYKDDYWTLRTADGSVAPRWQDPITDEELEGSIYGYAYSSIMDYSRLTQDAHGPGKYDESVILVSYANAVERYVDPGGIADFNLFNDWAMSDGTILTFYYPQPEAFHYTEWYNRMGSLLYEASNRELVTATSCEDVASTNDPCMDWTTGTYLDPEQGVFAPRVPYIFCSPYQSDIGNGCFTRDYGADEYERISHHIASANTWYVSRAFTRYAVGIQPEDYIGRTYSRIYRRLKGYNDYYALIVGLLRGYNFPESGIQGFLTDETTGWGSYTIAEHDMMNFLFSTIATPDIKAFEPATDAAGENFLGEALFLSGTRTSLATGRYFTTTWWDANGNDTCGMNFWECLHHFGFYLDKIMALEALTDSATYFVARDTAEDLREWRISFYDNYGPQIKNFFGSILAQDYDQFAPYYVSFTDVRYPDYVLGDLPSAGTPLEPATKFTVQLYAAVLGMARFQNNFDKSFLDSSRMWLQGSGFALDSDFGAVTYEDPISGKRYQALNYPSADGIAQRMIDRANRVLARSNYCTSCVPGLDPSERARADGELVLYGQMLDVMVDLTGYYETYTQGYGDPYNPGEIP